MTNYIVVSMVAWIFLAILCGLAADRRGYSAVLGFVASMIVGPLITIIVVVLLPRRERVGTRGDGETLEDRNIRAIAETWRESSSRSGVS